VVIIDLDVSGGANLVRCGISDHTTGGDIWVNLDAVSLVFRSLGAYDRRCDWDQQPTELPS
jgi:hypothetical protein